MWLLDFKRQFATTSHETTEAEMWSCHHAATATAELSSRHSGRTQVNAITCLHGNYPDDLSWEVGACLMRFLVVLVRWFWYTPEYMGGGKRQKWNQPGKQVRPAESWQKKKTTKKTVWATWHNILQQSEGAAEENHSRQHHKWQDADLIWLMLMIVTTNASSPKLHPPSLLRCFAVWYSCGWGVRAPAELRRSVLGHPYGCPLRVQLKDQRTGCVMGGCQREFFKSLGNIQRCRWVLWLRKTIERWVYPSTWAPFGQTATTGNPATVLPFHYNNSPAASEVKFK